MAAISEAQKKDAQIWSDWLNQTAIDKDFCDQFEREVSTLKRELSVTLPKPKVHDKQWIDIRFTIAVPQDENKSYEELRREFVEAIDRALRNPNGTTDATEELAKAFHEKGATLKITNYGMNEGRRRVR